jgi:hypothetical protein
MDALPAGSYLAISMPTDEIDLGPIAEIKRHYEARGEVVRFRSKAEVEAFIQGLELIERGSCRCTDGPPTQPTSAPFPTAMSTCTAAWPASRAFGARQVRRDTAVGPSCFAVFVDHVPAAAQAARTARVSCGVACSGHGSRNLAAMMTRRSLMVMSS